MGDLAGISGLLHRGGDHRLYLLRVDPAGEILVFAERDALAHLLRGVPGKGVLSEELHRLRCVLREDRGEVDRHDPERVERGGERRARRLKVGLHRLPGLDAVEVSVRDVRKAAYLDDGLAESASLVVARDRRRGLAALRDHRRALGVHRAEAPVEALVDHLRRARGDVGDLADEVGVDALHEVGEVEVDVVDRAAELRGVVVPQGLRRKVVEVRAGRHERALGLRHLLAVDGQEAVDEHLVRALEARDVEHPRPEEAVEADDVLADEVVELRLRVVPHVEAPEVLQRGDVADRRVHPHVEELAGVAGDLEAEVRRVAGDAPAAQRLAEPLEQLVRDVRRRVLGDPPLEVLVLRLQLEVEVLRVAERRRAAARRADGIPKLLGRVRRAAAVAAVAVLPGRAALGARALHEAVGQEHAALLAVELRRGPPGHRARPLHRREYRLGKLPVLRRVRRVVVVEAYLEVGEVPEVRLVGPRDELLRRHALSPGADHHRRAVRVVGAHVDAVVAAEPLVPDPEVGLQILHQVPYVYVAVRVGQRARYDDPPLPVLLHLDTSVRRSPSPSSPRSRR